MSWTATKIRMAGPLAAPSLTRVIHAIAVDGDEALIVGGAVRNALLGRPVSDIDIATTAPPDSVIARTTKAGLKPVPTGIEHGTITVVADGRGYEVTTLRRDIETDGRRAIVAFGRDFVEDAHRRDFTINGLYARLDGTVFDPVNGLADIAIQRVRFIGDPATRIREDYLRILRFFRFFGDYDVGDADRPALTAIAREIDGLDQLSRERVRSEFLKILAVRRAPETISLLQHYEILPHILGRPTEPERLVKAIALIPELPPIARLAALLDETIALDELRARLRLSNDETRKVHDILEAVRMMKALAMPLTDRALRAVAFRCGRAPTLAGLAIYSAEQDTPVLDNIQMAAIESAPQKSPFSGEMMLKLGLAAGPQMGRAIERAELLWIEADFPDDPVQIDFCARRAIMVN